MDLIDTDIIPDPFEPHIGDVYGRAATNPSDGLPVRLVVAELGEGALNDDMTLLVDAREEQVSNLVLYLASIPGIAPLGRVREARKS